MSRSGPGAPELSIVVPFFNEVGTIDELHRRLTAVLFLIGLPSEIIYVDDGSTDGTAEALTAIADRDPHVRLMPLARNYGQTAALAAGFDVAAGRVIVALDGDLQHEPLLPQHGARGISPRSHFWSGMLVRQAPGIHCIGRIRLRRKFLIPPEFFCRQKGSREAQPTATSRRPRRL